MLALAERRKLENAEENSESKDENQKQPGIQPVRCKDPQLNLCHIYWMASALVNVLSLLPTSLRK